MTQRARPGEGELPESIALRPTNGLADHRPDYHQSLKFRVRLVVVAGATVTPVHVKLSVP